MSQAFDPYRQWLGIPKNEPRPLNYYRLLGVEKFESDPAVIANSADRQIDHLRKYSASEHGELAERLINELIKAKLVLIKPERREAYNQTLLSAPQNSGPPKTFAAHESLARPVTPAMPPPRVELSSDPAQWDLEGLVPPEPEAMPAAQSLPESAALSQPSSSYIPPTPAVFSAPNQPYLQPPVAYAQVPVPYAQAPVPFPPGNPPLAPQPAAAIPAAYSPQQQSGPGPRTPPVLLPPHLLPQAHVPVSSPTTQQFEQAAETNDDMPVNAQELRARHDSWRLRRLYMSLALSGALALIILGTVVGLVVSKYGLNPPEPVATNTPVAAKTKEPEAKLLPANPDVVVAIPDRPNPERPVANPNRPVALPVNAVAAEQPADELFNAFELPAGKPFQWPAVRNPRVPQIVDFQDDVNKNPKHVYRYPGTNPRMATVISDHYSPNRWLVEKDQLIYQDKNSTSNCDYLLFGDPNWTDYTVEFETYFDGRVETIWMGMLFRCAEQHHLPMFLQRTGRRGMAQLSFWEPALPNRGGIQDEQGKAIESVDDTFSPNSWKKTSVTVAGKKIVAKSNGKILFDKVAEFSPRGQVGMMFMTSAAGQIRIRNIRVTAPDGKVLWEGVPELPPGLDKAVTRLWPQPDFWEWHTPPKKVFGGGWEVQDQGQGKLLQGKCGGAPAVMLASPFNSRNYILTLKIRKLQGVFELLAFPPNRDLSSPDSNINLYIKSGNAPIDTPAASPVTIQFVKAADGYALLREGKIVYTKLAANPDLSQETQGGLALTKPDSEVVIQEIVVRRMPDSFRLEELQRMDPNAPQPAAQLALPQMPAPKAPQQPVNKVEPPPAVAKLELPYKLKTPSNSRPPATGLVLKQGEPFEWAPVDAELKEQQSGVHYADVNGRRLVMYRYLGINPRMATVISRAHMPGKWAIENNELTFENSVSDSEFLLFGDPAWTDYTVEFESYVERTNAICPVGVLFRCAEDHRLHLFQHSKQREKAELLMWRPETPKFSPLLNSKGQPIPPSNFVAQQRDDWRKHSVTVTGDRIVAKRDQLVMFDNTAQISAQGRVGMKFELVEDGKVHVRNIRVTSPDGAVLWEGLPELPTLLEHNAYMVWPDHFASHWTKVPKKVANPGDWQVRSERGQRRVLSAEGKQNPPLLFDNSDHMNYVLEVKIRKLRGEFDLVLNIPKPSMEPETAGTRLHLSYANQPPDAAGQPMFLQLTRAQDGFLLRVNDETVLQHRRPGKAFELVNYGFDVLRPDSAIEIEEINIRRVPQEFRLYDEQFQAPPNQPKQRGENGWELAVTPPGMPKPPPALAVNVPPAPQQPAPQQAAANPPAAIPPRNPLADLVAKFGLDPEAFKGMPAAQNPDLMPRLTPLAVLAHKDEDLQKLLDEIEKTRAAYKDKLKQIDDDYLKAFDAEITRIRSSFKYNANERAALLEPLLEDKKAFTASRRFSLAHCMLPHNKAIALILVERQKLERAYEQALERLLKDKKDEAAVEVNKTRREDPDLAPLSVFQIMYSFANGGTPRRFEFFGDKTVNGNPKIAWTIDAEMRLILSGPVQYNDTNTVEVMQISIDGRKLLGGKASYSSNLKNGTVVTN